MPRGLTRTTKRAEAVSASSGYTRQRYTLTNVPATVTAITTGLGAASLSIPLPKGNVYVSSVYAELNYSTTSTNITNATFGSVLSLGTAAGAGDGVLTGTQANIVASTSSPAAVGKVVSGAKLLPTALLPVTAVFLINNTAGATGLFLNVGVTANDITDGASAPFLFNGFIDVLCAVMGNV